MMASSRGRTRSSPRDSKGFGRIGCLLDQAEEHAIMNRAETEDGSYASARNRKLLAGLGLKPGENEYAEPALNPCQTTAYAFFTGDLLQMLGDVVHRGARQEPVFPGCRDGGWVGPRPIGADPVRGEQRLVFQRLAEEALGRLQVALRHQQEVHGRAMLINGPVQIPPLAADLDVCFIDPD